MHCASPILSPLLFLIIEMIADHADKHPPVLHAVDRLEQLEGGEGLSWCLFTAPGCAPCQDIKRKLPQWGHDFLPSSQSFSIDLSLLPQASAAFQVLSVPTLIVCLDGQEIARQVRYINFTLLKEQLARPVALWQSSLSAPGG